MHPAFSVLFFTVTSGLGYGFMLSLVACQLSGYLVFNKYELLLNSTVAAGLFTAGLLSSTLHLANPGNAWRSFTRFKTSWLSREAVFAVLAYPLIGLYLAAAWFEITTAWVDLLALIIISLILVLLFCTAMIYASLKTIPQWHSPYVPIAFILFGVTGGLLCLGLANQWQASGLRISTVAALIACLLLKLFYYRSLGAPARSTINTATSFSQAKVTLFDAGHSSENFLQREFIYEVGPKTIRLARNTAMLLAFIFPAILLVTEHFQAGTMLASWVAVASLYSGLLLERWLFFIEARHVVRLYYDKA